MYTIDRLTALLSHYGLPGEFEVTHNVLDKLDKAAGLNTRGRYVGARVALHEKYKKIMSNTPKVEAPERAPPEPSMYFWLGEEGDFYKLMARDGAGRVTCSTNRTKRNILKQVTFFSFTGHLEKVNGLLYGIPLSPLVSHP